MGAVSLVDAVLHAGKKKGADRGIDGIRFVQIGPNKGDLARVLISVKGGEHVSVKDIRDLRGTVERERALAGFFLTFTEPTKEMRKEAAAGVVEIHRCRNCRSSRSPNCSRADVPTFPLAAVTKDSRASLERGHARQTTLDL